jgi:hypothetical protein
MQRRDFLKWTGVAFLAPSLLAHAADPLPMVDPKDTLAEQLKYVEDYKKSPFAKGKKCSTCSFFTKGEKRNGKDAGACQIFAGKNVYANAYCNSWQEKKKA